MSLHVFVTEPGRSSHSGSAWVTATRTAVEGLSVDDMMGPGLGQRSAQLPNMYRAIHHGPLLCHVGEDKIAGSGAL